MALARVLACGTFLQVELRCAGGRVARVKDFAIASDSSPETNRKHDADQALLVTLPPDDAVALLIDAALPEQASGVGDRNESVRDAPRERRAFGAKN
jgi:hypothetical protein